MVTLQQVLMTRPDGVAVRAQSGPFDDADAALAALRGLQMPSPAMLSSRVIGIWIDDSFARLFGATWPVDVADLATFRTFLAARFEQRFELPADQWTIVAPGAWPGRPVLCVAAPRSLIDGLRESVGSYGLRPGRLLPMSLVEVAASVPTRPRSTTLFVGSAGPTRTVFLLSGGRLTDCAVLPDTAHPEALAEAIFRERGLISGDVRRSVVVETDRRSATESLLARMPLPVRPVLPDPSPSPSFAGRS